jgi:hypothetical protein
MEDLDAEAEESPPSSELGTKKRQPWRREDVFRYELCWARYFVREAELFERRTEMTEQELDEQHFMDRLYPIPKDLKIYLKNNLNKKRVLELWKTWHHKKRGTMPQGHADPRGKRAKGQNAELVEDDMGNGEGFFESPAMSVTDLSFVAKDEELAA